MLILAIETSCDETAAAVLESKNGKFRLLANVVASSVELQAKYGGIVPEVAARKQIEFILPVIETALTEFPRNNSQLPNKFQISNFKFQKENILKNKKLIDYIAVTNGPGLITSLRVGVEAAKTLAYAWQKPLIAVNHLEGHMYSALLNNFQFSIFNFQKIDFIIFPALALVVSGGHTMLVLLKDYLKYKVIGETLDDAVGEAFDKVAKILGLGYPGGPIISKLAASGNPKAMVLPRPMIKSNDYNFSFSGIKTAVLYLTKHKTQLTKNQESKKSEKQYINDLCASFQAACVEVLVYKTMRAAKEHEVKSIILGGGVAANPELRRQLSEAVGKIRSTSLLMPELKFTGDNAAMIALTAYYKIKAKKFIDWRKIKTEANMGIESR